MASETSREKMRQQDHDLLIRLDEKVTDISNAIKDLKDGLNLRVTNLEARMNNAEDRIAKIESGSKIVLWLIAPIYLGVIGYLVGRFVALF